MEDVPTERLEAQITELAGHLAAAECRWLELVGEFDRRKAYEAWGCISCAYWLSWHCGLDLRSARDKVRVARALEDLRLIREKFAAGRYQLFEGAGDHPGGDAGHRRGSGDAGRALDGRAAGADRRRRIRRGINLEEERRGVRDRHARTQAMFLGRRRLRGDDGTVRARRRRGRQGGDAGSARGVVARRRFRGTAEPGPLGAKALVAMAESFLAHGPAARKDRYLAMIHVDADVLTDDTDGRCELDDGPALSPETARRIACDNPFIAVLLDSWASRQRWARKPRRSPPG